MSRAVCVARCICCVRDNVLLDIISSIRGRPIRGLDFSCIQCIDDGTLLQEEVVQLRYRVGGQRVVVVGDIVVDGEDTRQPSHLPYCERAL